jgi:phosphate transport system permease protein
VTRRRLRRLALLSCALFLVLIGGLLLVGLLLGAALGPELPASPLRLGTRALVGGTLLVALVALVVAVPLGLLAAIHLSEFSNLGRRRWLELVLDTLAGVPGVIFGLLAVVFVGPALPDGAQPYSALLAGLVLGVMVLPLYTALARDALQAVPVAVREAAIALGARELPVIFQVLLPTAAPGLVGAVLLAFARAAAETVVVALTVGHATLSGLSLAAPAEPLTGYLVRAASDGGGLSAVVFEAGLWLFLITAASHLAGQWLTGRRRGGNA